MYNATIVSPNGKITTSKYSTFEDIPVRDNIVVRPEGVKNIKLAVFDVDGTLLGEKNKPQECINEMAKMAKVEYETSQITKAAMAGDIDFSDALQKRIKLIKSKGLTEGDLEEIWKKVQFSPGAQSLATLFSDARLVVVSGGFTFFTEKVCYALGFHAHHGNELIFDGHNRISGVREPILTAKTKRDLLMYHANDLGIEMNQVLAVGDGANDLAMLEYVKDGGGVPIGYSAKPILRQKIPSHINDFNNLKYAFKDKNNR